MVAIDRSRFHSEDMATGTEEELRARLEALEAGLDARLAEIDAEEEREADAGKSVPLKDVIRRTSQGLR